MPWFSLLFYFSPFYFVCVIHHLPHRSQQPVTVHYHIRIYTYFFTFISLLEILTNWYPSAWTVDQLLVYLQGQSLQLIHFSYIRKWVVDCDIAAKLSIQTHVSSLSHSTGWLNWTRMILNVYDLTKTYPESCLRDEVHCIANPPGARVWLSHFF